MMRSPTAEETFKGDPRLEVKSAGVSRNAVVPVTGELLNWADMVFVMEKKQQDTIQTEFKEFKNQQIISLNIADCYDYMDPVLIDKLKKEVEPYLPDY